MNSVRGKQRGVIAQDALLSSPSSASSFTLERGGLSVAIIYTCFHNFLPRCCPLKKESVIQGLAGPSHAEASGPKRSETQAATALARIGVERLG